ncbi:MAG: type II secretion system F family protein [Planctomycetaceae bacterium]|nr:type II secretion system F family protein [Planctomycetaceae bacterium]
MFLNLVAVGTFLIISLTVFLISEAIRNSKRRARSISDLNLSDDHPKRPLAPSAFQRAMAGALPQSAKEIAKIEKDLKRAGYYRPWALIDYLSTRNTLVTMILVGFGILAVLAPPSNGMGPVLIGIGLLTALLGYSLPRLLLSHQALKRITKIHKGLPDALDIVHMCLSSGLSLRDSLQRVASEIEVFNPEIAVEFELVRRHSEADSMAKALSNFADRLDTPDVNALASLVTQSDKLGIHVAEAVTEFAVGVRRTFQQRADERANKTTIKLLFPVVLCLAPPIYILLMGPPLLKMRDFIQEANQRGGVLDVSEAASAFGEVAD